MEQLYGTWKDDPDAGATTNNKNRWAFYQHVFEQYHAFYLNDSLLKADIIKYAHENLGEDGILCYLPVANLPVGKHVLRIEKKGTDPEKPYRYVVVPFWKE